MMFDLIDENSWLRGQVEELVLTVMDEENNLVDLTDPSITALEFRVKKSAGDADPPVLSLSLGDGITPRDQTGVNRGLADITATADQTFALGAGLWHYDVLLIFGTKRKFVVDPSLLHVKDVVNFP